MDPNNRAVTSRVPYKAVKRNYVAKDCQKIRARYSVVFSLSTEKRDMNQGRKNNIHTYNC